MNLPVQALYVDDVQLRTPRLDGIKVTQNKIWSANTGRLELTAKMVGTIVAVKQKLEISWPEMTMAEVNTIEAIVSATNPWHTLKYVDMTGQTKELEVYFGDPSYTIRSPAMDRVNNVSVSAIER